MILFSHIHKSGGTTLKWILRNSFGLRHLEIDPIHPQPAYPKYTSSVPVPHIDRAKVSLQPISPKELKMVMRAFPHVRSLHSHNLSPSVDLGEHTWFTFVRDPRKQVASWFQYLIEFGKRTDLNFNNYIKTEFPRERQCKMIGGKPYFKDAAKTIRNTGIFCGIVEEFDSSLVLMKGLHIPDLNINYSSRGVARTGSIAKDILSDKTCLRLIDEVTVEDRILYDYIQKEIFPNYIESYGHTFVEDLRSFRMKRGTFNFLRVNLSRIQSRLFYEHFYAPSVRKISSR